MSSSAPNQPTNAELLQDALASSAFMEVLGSYRHNTPQSHNEYLLTKALLNIVHAPDWTQKMWEEDTKDIDWELIPPSNVATNAFLTGNPKAMALVPVNWLDLHLPIPPQQQNDIQLRSMGWLDPEKNHFETFHRHRTIAESNFLVRNWIHKTPDVWFQSFARWSGNDAAHKVIRQCTTALIKMLTKQKKVTGDTLISTNSLWGGSTPIKTIDMLIANHAHIKRHNRPLQSAANTMWTHWAPSATWSSPQEAATTLRAWAQSIGELSASPIDNFKEPLGEVMKAVLAQHPPWHTSFPLGLDNIPVSLAGWVIMSTSACQVVMPTKDQPAWLKQLHTAAWSQWTALPLEQQQQEIAIVFAQADANLGSDEHSNALLKSWLHAVPMLDPALRTSLLIKKIRGWEDRLEKQYVNDDLVAKELKTTLNILVKSDTPLSTTAAQHIWGLVKQVVRHHPSVLDKADGRHVQQAVLDLVSSWKAPQAKPLAKIICEAFSKRQDAANVVNLWFAAMDSDITKLLAHNQERPSAPARKM